MSSSPNANSPNANSGNTGNSGNSGNNNNNSSQLKPSGSFIAYNKKIVN